MLFETLKQFYISLGAIYFGLVAGIIKDIINFFRKPIKNKVVQNILDFVLVLIFSFLFVICINIINFGEFRFYLLIVFIVGFIIERMSLGFLVDFVLEKVYNFFVKLIKILAKTKFIKRIFGLDYKKRKKDNSNR